MTRRILSLKRETLAELSPDELGVVAAAGSGEPRCIKTLNGCVLPSMEYSCLRCITHPPCITDVTN